MHLNENEIYLGVEDTDFIICKTNKDHTIKGFDHYSEERFKNSTIVLSWYGWDHNVTVNGKVYKSGDICPKGKDITKDTKAEYKGEFSYCEDCDCLIDLDNRETYRLVDGAFYCLDCVKAVDIVKEIVEPYDFFKAPNICDLDLARLKEVDCLFCDSSGFGSSNETALTQDQATNRIKELLKKHKKLYCGITCIGQFQIYVTIFTKKRVKK
ncbi:MAG: hypothetical protein PHF86_10655 [Candidatus Nanoarchaeia archaeon]|nr:hypothetical protein [Candidatus Nanoarchaeia archaeon]